MQPHTQENPVPGADKIQRQLQRILDSQDFQATDRQREFLQFVVTETIAGRRDEIKGYTVATQVFGRGQDFDQATDPIVSIHANKLRRALERYYLVAGQNDPVHIDIPKGTYVPTFQERIAVEAERASSDPEGGQIPFEGSWPCVVILPFKNLTGDPEQNYLGIGVAMELAMELTRYQDIRVLMSNPGGYGKGAQNYVARFVIDGSILKDNTGIKVAVRLIDTATGVHIWGDMHRSGFEAAQMITFEEEVARVVAAKVASESGIIAKTLSLQSRNIPSSDLNTYEAFLRYYEFNLDFSAETFLRAFKALKIASAREPECGLVWSMLGRLYAVNYSLELLDLETPIEDAVAFAMRGVKLEPANQRVRLIMAYVLLFKNEIAAGLAETERALALNPNSLIFLENIGYLMTLLGDWKRGPALIKQAIKLNPYYSIVVHYALWVDWIRQEDYDQAYLESLNFNNPMLFWDPLMKAASLGLLGRIAEGEQAIEHLLKLKPDFPTRGRVLIKHYIKFENIAERLIDGLRKVGLNID
jgi:TolB-like protein